MQKLIKDGVIQDNTWTLVTKADGDAASADVPAGQVLIPVSVWFAQKAQLQNRTDIGVWLDSNEAAEVIAEDAHRFAVIGINFPGFMDGRAFSTARLLRERYGFTGELRAVGNFIRDQLCYLRRCGVNAFAFTNPDANLEEAVQSLNDFQEYYQASVDQPLPLFRRRA
jgi:uncharacterized protein (DUF934 family)